MNTTHLFFCATALCFLSYSAVFSGCGSSQSPELPSITGAGGAGGTGASDSSGGGGTANIGGAGGSGGAPITWPQPCADIYDENTLPTFELIFTPDEYQALQSDCANNIQQYRPVKFIYGAETADAMARLKGNWSWDCNKMQFVISFNEIDPKGRFHGLRKIVLDAPWYDRTLMHERLAMSFFGERGIPHSCVNSAKLKINGEYYGLYSNVERLDKEYLQRNFEQAEGNLYEGGVELKTNETIGDTSDLAALNAAQTVEELAQHMDLNQAVSEWAVEAMLPAMDNFWAGVEINYYIYHHPMQGFIYLPYDMDIVFGDSAYPDGSLIWPDSVTADPITYEHPFWQKEDRMKMVLSDAGWCQAFVDEVVKAREAYSPAKLSAKVDAWDAQIKQALADDPRKPFTSADHNTAIVSLKKFFQDRADFVDQWLAQGGHCPGKF